MHEKSQTGKVLLWASLVSMSAIASAQEITEIVVEEARNFHEISTVDTLVAPADTAGMLKSFPGTNVNKNGELTGIAQYRGMYGDRINVAVNGHRISSSGPNAMDAPLHYAPVALLEALIVHRGIAPVSSGMETIGGSIKAETYSGEFAGADAFVLNSRIYTGIQDVNSGYVASGVFSYANDTHLLATTFLREEADDSRFPGGSIQPSLFARDRYSISYGYRDMDAEINAEYIINKTGEAGTASLPMDIDFVDSDIVNLEYRQDNFNYSVKGSISIGHLSHGMSNFHMRKPPLNPMLYRHTLAESANKDFSLSLEKYTNNGLWRVGVDGHFANHDTYIHNPNTQMFGIESFQDVRRNLVGLYLEREGMVFGEVSLQAGIRVNRVNMTAGQIGANLNPMNVNAGMPLMMDKMANTLSDRFNNLEREKTDINHDLFARLNLTAGDNTVMYFGMARKMRSPSYQERFAWIPLEISGGLADGKTYVGNVDLAPESSKEVEFGFDFKTGSFELYPRIFYKDITNYIQGVPATDSFTRTFASMMANMGMGSTDPLVYSNVSARIYGMDITSKYHVTERLHLSGTYNLVRAEREDIKDNLYRISPDNMMLALQYRGNTFTTTIEAVAYSRQNRVSAVNSERTTPGYGIANLSFNFNPLPNVEAGLGIENVFDREYVDHLGGYNRAVTDSVPLRGRLPGLGRNVYARLIWNI